ncbi:hypothetical protein Pan216_34220 [Planctomycetes bacterium Pan216]|uniref:Transcription termination factor Rho n=1 Tax=Kolteria novifilia TaxID=2527975 RepID=A0A518B6F1_9BACT|nr:hypothetical protein Pan216_34220 [Planctomycetes bacterium Pan216]
MPEPNEQARDVDGILELHPSGYGFVRNVSMHCGSRPDDAFVSADMIRRLDLREGLLLEGGVEAGRANDRGRNDRQRRNDGSRNQRRGKGPQQRRNDQKQGPRLRSVNLIEGEEADKYRQIPVFDTLTPIDPHQWLRLETTAEQLTTRVVDMFTPIGKGQRGLIVAPPRSGKTFLIKHIAEGITANHPDIELIVLLIDERPEEVTDMQRSINGTVFASSNDRETSSHVRLAELVIERSKRLTEMGKDVVVLMDSITRLARAYNKHVGTTGRTMSGGLDIRALEIPKRLFGTARVFEEGGSLTVLASALIDTGSRMDDVIFQEFKGTGNMELVLDHRLADRRVYPAIDMFQSGTRKEERLLPPDDLEKITLIRRTLAGMHPVEAMQTLISRLAKSPSNEAFLDQIRAAS